MFTFISFWIQNVFYQIELKYFVMHMTGEKPLKPNRCSCLQIQMPHIWTTAIADEIDPFTAFEDTTFKYISIK